MLITKEQYIAAAKLVAEKKADFCCVALSQVGAPESATMAELFAGEPDTCNSAWMSLVDENVEAGRERRILALLFMAAMS